jgi:hypothetical protein
MRFLFWFSILMERRWNEIDSGKPKYSEKSLSQCHFVHHKSNIDWPGIEPELTRWGPATNRLSHGTSSVQSLLYHRSERKKVHILPTQCIYVFCVKLKINSFNWFVFTMEMECVYSAVRTLSLDIIQLNLTLWRANFGNRGLNWNGHNGLKWTYVCLK